MSFKAMIGQAVLYYYLMDRIMPRA